ncbi:MAG: cation transporter [Chloroflexi bacterium]|nr:cation transporter [Chloroflexota bacterium]
MDEEDRNKVQLPVAGMSCAYCATHIQEALSSLSGVISSEVSHSSGTAIVDYLPARIGLDGIKEAIRGAGYSVESAGSFQSIRTKSGEQWVQAYIEAIDKDRCNGCGKCVRSCGQNVFSLVEVDGSRKATVVNDGACLGDCHCHKACQNGALICRPRRLEGSVRWIN